MCLATFDILCCQSLVCGEYYVTVYKDLEQSSDCDKMFKGDPRVKLEHR